VVPTFLFYHMYFVNLAVMKEFVKVLFPHTKPYLPYALLNFIFNGLGVLFSLFSLTLIIPFLSVLFGTKELIREPVPITFSIDSLQHNFYYLLSEIITEKGDFQALVYLSIWLIISFLFKNLFIYLARFYMVIFRIKIIRDIRNVIFQKIVNLPMSYFSNARKGDLMVRFTKDMDEIEGGVIGFINMLFRDMANIIVFLVALIIMSPTLTAFVFILLPISGFIISRVGKSLRKRSTLAQSKLGEVISHLEETISGLKIIKAFTAEDKIISRFGVYNQEFTIRKGRVEKRKDLASPLSEFLGAMVIVIIMYYGGNLVLTQQGDLPPEAFIAYLAIFSQLIEPAKQVSNGFYGIQKGLASFDRVNSVITADIKIEEKPNAAAIKNFEHAIEYDNVSFRYTRENVLKNISLSIYKGQSLALVGKSGSGKSTLVDLLLRYYDVSSGSIKVDGKDIRDYKVSDLRKLIGYVSQEPILFNDTIYNNIALGLEKTSENDVVEAAKVANAHEFIERADQGYDTVIGDRGGKLSGGQRQRLSIARAVLANPPILILDEATSALDTESERLVQEALINLMQNRTSIIIAHRLSTVRHADNICVLEDGVLKELGNHQDLLDKDGIYKKLHASQLA